MARNVLLLLTAFSLLAGFSNAYVTYIHAPAVLINLDRGTLTTVTLNITPGNGAVSVNHGINVNYTTTDSALTAAGYASAYLGVDENKYNFNYTINNNDTNISGPSAGLAFTLLAISGIEKRPLLHNFTVTGTIASNGSVGEIGGVYDKVGSANASGLSFVLVPYAPNNTIEYLLYYISQQHYHTPLVEVKNATQALPYAFEPSRVQPLSYNISYNYNAARLPVSNVSCSSCNTSSFALLANYTFNLTRNEIEQVNGSRYASVKAQMLNQLSQYEAIAGKGYLYTGADLAFLEYQQAFIFANADNYNLANASTVLSQASQFCSSLTVPQLTNKNYEYVTGGQLRQSWANITINNSRLILNSSETTDEIIDALYYVAPAYGWCQGAREMYGIASLTGGTPVAFNENVQNAAESNYNVTAAVPGDRYATSLVDTYNQGAYAASIYAAAYAKTFDSPTTPQVPNNATGVAMVNAEIANATGSAFGIWAQQFASEAQFYMAEANITNNSSFRAGYLQDAYSSALLSQYISQANRLISTNEMYNLSSTIPASSPALQAQLNQLSKQISNLYTLVYVLFAILFVAVCISLALTVHLLRKPRVKGSRARRQA